MDQNQKVVVKSVRGHILLEKYLSLKQRAYFKKRDRLEYFKFQFGGGYGLFTAGESYYACLLLSAKVELFLRNSDIIQFMC